MTEISYGVEINKIENGEKILIDFDCYAYARSLEPKKSALRRFNEFKEKCKGNKDMIATLTQRTYTNPGTENMTFRPITIRFFQEGVKAHWTDRDGWVAEGGE